jgi:hypothetical protein
MLSFGGQFGRHTPEHTELGMWNTVFAAGVPPVQPPATVKPALVSLAVTMPVEVPAVTCCPT